LLIKDRIIHLYSQLVTQWKPKFLHDKMMKIQYFHIDVKIRIADEDKRRKVNTAEARKYCRTSAWISSPSVVF